MLYEDFRKCTFFPSIQSLRTLSVVLVIAVHMQDYAYWGRTHGAVGVTIFFVLSGFLISTLLLRRAAETFWSDLWRFYVRRAFRLLPLYFVVLGVFCFLILVLKVSDQEADFRRALPYYFTYQNDFVPEAPYGQTWSLAIEEKFYLLWPLVLLLPVRLRFQAMFLAAALLLTSVIGLADRVNYFGIFVPIIAGCLVALCLHDRRSFDSLSILARPPVCLGFILAAAICEAVTGDNGRVHVLFSLFFATALPGIVLAQGRFRKLLEIRLLVWAGSRTYAAYLIHPVIKSGVDIVIPANGDSLLPVLLRFTIVVVFTFIIADALFRTIERPITRFGRTITSTARTVPNLRAQ